jgi:hypothetical protein
MWYHYWYHFFKLLNQYLNLPHLTMRLIHSQLTVPERVKAPTKNQVYHAEMVAALRRKRYADFEQALKDPEVIELLKQVQKVSPGWQPTFNG